VNSLNVEKRNIEVIISVQLGTSTLQSTFKIDPDLLNYQPDMGKFVVNEIKVYAEGLIDPINELRK
jgi:hypothetical protein